MGEMDQLFCAFDFKRRDEIEEVEKKKQEKRGKNEVENPTDEFHRVAATRNRSRMISVDEIFII